MAQHFFTAALAELGPFLGTEKLPLDLAAGGSNFIKSWKFANAANRIYYAVDSGSVNVMTITLPAVGAETQAQLVGVELRVLVNVTNTNTTPTLNVNGLGAQNVVSVGAGGVAGIGVGTAASGKILNLVWDGTNYQMLGRLVTASEAQIEAGTDFLSPITSSGLRAAMPFANSPVDGYQVLPTGIIIQWGTFTTVTGVNDDLNFPVTFPNAVLSFVATATVVGAPMVSFVGSGGITTSDVKLGTGELTAFPLPASGAGVPVRWVAIGH